MEGRNRSKEQLNENFSQSSGCLTNESATVEKEPESVADKYDFFIIPTENLPTSDLLKLPDELLLYIFNFLDVTNLAVITLINKNLHNLIARGEPSFFMKKFEKEFLECKKFMNGNIKKTMFSSIFGLPKSKFKKRFSEHLRGSIHVLYLSNNTLIVGGFTKSAVDNNPKEFKFEFKNAHRHSVIYAAVIPDADGYAKTLLTVSQDKNKKAIMKAWSLRKGKPISIIIDSPDDVLLEYVGFHNKTLSHLELFAVANSFAISRQDNISLLIYASADKLCSYRCSELGDSLYLKEYSRYPKTDENIKYFLEGEDKERGIKWRRT